MVKRITKISDDIIEVVEDITQTQVKQFNKNVLLKEKSDLQDKIVEINKLLTEF